MLENGTADVRIQEENRSILSRLRQSELLRHVSVILLHLFKCCFCFKAELYFNFSFFIIHVNVISLACVQLYKLFKRLKRFLSCPLRLGTICCKNAVGIVHYKRWKKFPPFHNATTHCWIAMLSELAFNVPTTFYSESAWRISLRKAVTFFQIFVLICDQNNGL